MMCSRQINGSEYFDTYYVYDDIGNQRFVLQPMYQNTADISLYAFQYNYDSRHRCIWKKLPGCEYISYIYDNADHLLFSQDGEQRKSGKWRFYLYDYMGRLCVQGISSSATAGSGSAIVRFQSSQSGICSTGYVLFGTCSLTSPVPELVHYYDNYDYQQHSTFTSCSQSSRLTKASPANATGLITGSIIKQSDGDKIYSAIYYDKYGRPVDSRKALPDGKVITENMSYSFTDNLVVKSLNVYNPTGNSVSATVNNTYSDAFDKLTESQLTVGGKSVKTSSISYDQFGRLGSITRSGSAGTLSYGYNLRNWLTSISGSLNMFLYYNSGNSTSYFNGNISSMFWQNDNNTVLHGYEYSYDGANRMLSAIYKELSSFPTNVGRYNEVVSSYDKNGSITRFVRTGRQNTGRYGPIDNLTITYNGNQLSSVSDAVGSLTYNGSFDFKDNTSSSMEYTYDANGRLTSDSNRGIALIEYDSYDNLRRIQFTNGNVTRYVYSVLGEKLRVVHQIAVPNVSVAVGSKQELTPSLTLSADSTDYIDNLIFSNGKLDRLLFGGGYCSFTGGNLNSAVFHYYDCDHQGNIRAVVNENGAKEQITHYYPFGGIIADLSPNKTLQPYKYNGKELDRMHGLDTYDYGARQYNPALPIWDKPDVYSEKYYNVNPYVYCHNNPINRIDPDGMDDYYSITGQYLSHEDNGTDFIIIRDQFIHELKQTYGMEWLKSDTPISEMTLTAKAYSNIFTDILSKMDGVDVNDLYNGKVSVTVWEDYGNLKATKNQYNDARLNGDALAQIGSYQGKQRLTAYIYPKGDEEKELFSSKYNIQNLLGVHEYIEHFKNNIGNGDHSHLRIYKNMQKHPSWIKTTQFYKDYMINIYVNTKKRIK